MPRLPGTRPAMPPLFPPHLVARWLLVLVLLAGAYFFSLVLVPVLAALIIGLASWPLNKRWHRLCGGRDILAAGTTMLAIVVVLIVPLSMALSYAIKEASTIIGWMLN